MSGGNLLKDEKFEESQDVVGDDTESIKSGPVDRKIYPEHVSSESTGDASSECSDVSRSTNMSGGNLLKDEKFEESQDVVGDDTESIKSGPVDRKIYPEHVSSDSTGDASSECSDVSVSTVDLTEESMIDSNRLTSQLNLGKVDKRLPSVMDCGNVAKRWKSQQDDIEAPSGTSKKSYNEPDGISTKATDGPICSNENDEASSQMLPEYRGNVGMVEKKVDTAKGQNK